MFLTTLLGAVGGGVLGFIPLIGPLVNGVVAPALLVAVVGSAHAVRNDDGAFDGATSAVNRAGTSVMGAQALLTAIYVSVSPVLAGIGVVAVVAVGVLFAIERALGPSVGLAFAAIGYAGAIAAVGSITSIYQVSYFETIVEPTDLPDSHDWDDSGTDSGAFVIGDALQADPGSEEQSSSEPESGGFHVEMAGENDATDDDPTAENDGWGTGSTERDR